MAGNDDREDGWQLEDTGPEAYERYLVPGMFAPWADVLLARGELAEGDRVLDVACGTGIVARRAAPRVGRAGSVVGVDLNAAMLDVARTASSGSEPAIEWRRGDATDLPFPDGSFDLAFCQQALQFIPEPVDALREMYRVLDTGGRMATNVWRPLPFNHTYEVLADALDRYVGEEAGTMMRSPFPDWEKDHLRAHVREAGFTDALLTIEVGSMRYPSIEALLRREAASSPLAGPLGDLDSDTRRALLSDLRDALEGRTDDRGVVFPMETYVVAARR